MFTLKQFQDNVATLTEQYETVIEINKQLQKENVLLKSEQYKDKELKSLQEKIELLEKRCIHHGMKEFVYKDISRWIEQHKQVCPKCVTHLEIYPYAITTCYTIVCEECKEEFNSYD